MRRVMNIQPDEHALIEEAVRAMAIKAREENAGLEARIEVLESRSVSIQDTARSGASIRKTRARKVASKNPKTSDAEK